MFLINNKICQVVLLCIFFKSSFFLLVIQFDFLFYLINVVVI